MGGGEVRERANDPRLPPPLSPPTLSFNAELSFGGGKGTARLVFTHLRAVPILKLDQSTTFLNLAPPCCTAVAS